MGKYGNRFNDLSGKRFGKLLVVKRISPVGQKVIWECKCECENTINLPTSYLTSGDTQSCGCLREKQSEINLREKYEKKRVEDVFVPSLKRKVNKDSKSGVKGVTWDRANEKWLAKISVNKKEVFLGRYDKLKDAIQARKEAEEKYHRPYIKKLEEKQNGQTRN